MARRQVGNQRSGALVGNRLQRDADRLTDLDPEAIAALQADGTIDPLVNQRLAELADS